MEVILLSLTPALITMGVTAASLECILSCLGFIITLGLLLWVNSINDPVKLKSSQCERVTSLPPNHEKLTVENRSAIGAIDIPSVLSDWDETKLTGARIVKRNALPPSKVNNQLEAIDCDRGVISLENRFNDCRNAKRGCHKDELITLKDLIETGTSIDIFYYIHIYIYIYIYLQSA